jgi:NAD kinase
VVVDSLQALTFAPICPLQRSANPLTLRKNIAIVGRIVKSENSDFMASGQSLKKIRRGYYAQFCSKKL